MRREAGRINHTSLIMFLLVWVTMGSRSQFCLENRMTVPSQSSGIWSFSSPRKALKEWLVAACFHQNISVSKFRKKENVSVWQNNYLYNIDINSKSGNHCSFGYLSHHPSGCIVCWHCYLNCWWQSTRISYMFSNWGKVWSNKQKYDLELYIYSLQASKVKSISDAVLSHWSVLFPVLSISQVCYSKISLFRRNYLRCRWLDHTIDYFSL